MISKLKFHKLKEKQKSLINDISFTDDNFVFTNQFSNCLSDSNIHLGFQRFLKRNNVKIKKFHSLRRTFATKLFKEGVKLLTVSKLLGHTNLETTKIYTKVSEEEKEDAINKLNKFFI